MLPLTARAPRLVAAGVGIALAAAVAVSSLGSAEAEPRADNDGWTASWSAAMTPPGSDGLAAAGVQDTTLRQVVNLSLGGSSLRVRLSHEYGERAVQVAAVTVSAGARPVTVTFGGRTETALAPGVERVSDPVPLRVAADTDVAVDIYLPGPTGPLTQHPRGRATTLRADGDRTGADASFFTAAGSSRLLLSGIDVDSDAGAVVAFGDSITDGVGTRVDARRGDGRSFPALLADRMLDLPARDRLAVVNAGISGNRMLADRDAAGESALSRFEEDVLGQPGVQVVLLLEGINDIQQTLGSVHPRSLRNAYTQFVARAHAAGIKVVGATLTPYEGWVRYTAAGEADRREINEWIRTSGVFDAVVDLDAAVRDPVRPSRLLPAYDSGDGLHPNDAGYAAMASAFDLQALVDLAG